MKQNKQLFAFVFLFQSVPGELLMAKLPPRKGRNTLINTLKSVRPNLVASYSNQGVVE